MEAASDAGSTVADFLEVLASASIPWEGKASETTASNYFKNVQWSPDGTCIVSNSADNHVRTFVVPPDLLERGEEFQLKPYSTILSFEAVNAFACYPGFDLQNPLTTLILSTASDHPIRLNSALDGRLVASYPLVSPTTEAYIKPQSLLFAPDGSHFIAGSNNQISFFDVARVGESPVTSFKTGPKNSRSRWNNPGTALSGLISALDIDQQYNVLVAGTLRRQVGLYDAGGKGECVGVFSTAGTEADSLIAGSGITQLMWSRCGRYLHIAERKSDGCLVYDIRKTGQLLSWAAGRRAMTNQRMDIDLCYDRCEGLEILWAGGTDGIIRCWNELSAREGAVEPSREFTMHKDVVNSISIHSTASVIASAAGQWDLPSRESSLSCVNDVNSSSNLLMLSTRSERGRENKMDRENPAVRINL